MDKTDSPRVTYWKKFDGNGYSIILMESGIFFHETLFCMLFLALRSILEVDFFDVRNFFYQDKPQRSAPIADCLPSDCLT